MLDREKVGMIVAEFFGTAILATVAISASIYFSFTAAWYVALSAGIALAVIMTMIYRVSGAHVNPAITLGLWTLKKIPTPQAIVYVASQLLGGAVALAFVEYVTNNDILQAGATSVDARVFVAEMVGAAVFGMGVAAAVTQKLEGFHAAFAVGASLTLGMLIASNGGVGFINPAVALANNTWDKTVVIAPLLGSVVGMNIYSMFLAPAASLKRKK
ncbi:MAG: glycerol uptake facilitator-like aquaporin [Candidatus Saccharimonadales bacterium]|jgi:glycerol uptake facilitator-like aquaporin